nr:MAG TPA_asm: Protein of unknown function (DUF3270) [Caudoviricetes sp.]
MLMCLLFSTFKLPPVWSVPAYVLVLLVRYH